MSISKYLEIEEPERTESAGDWITIDRQGRFVYGLEVL